MTQFIKKPDGSWCTKKITLACTIIGTATGVVAVMPTASAYVTKAIAPWTSFPDKLQHLEDNQVRVEAKIDRVADAVGANYTNLTTLHIK